MELLNRIARSNGDLQRTVLALRLINKRLQHELSQLQAQANVKLRPEDFAAYFDQPEDQPENACARAGPVEPQRKSLYRLTKRRSKHHHGDTEG